MRPYSRAQQFLGRYSALLLFSLVIVLVTAPVKLYRTVIASGGASNQAERAGEHLSRPYQD